MVIFASIERTVEALRAIAREHKTVAGFIAKTRGMTEYEKICYIDELIHENRDLV